MPDNWADGLLDRLQEALRKSKPSIKNWIIAQLEATLAQIPFLEVSLKDPLPPVREHTPNRLLTPQQASDLLNIPVRWLYRHSKILPHRKFGRYTRFPERELLRWAERQQ